MLLICLKSNTPTATHPLFCRTLEVDKTKLDSNDFLRSECCRRVTSKADPGASKMTPKRLKMRSQGPLGPPWGKLGASRRSKVDFCTILVSIWGGKWDPNVSKNRSKINPVFETIFILKKNARRSPCFLLYLKIVK